MDQPEIILLCRKAWLGLISYAEIFFHMLIFYLYLLLVTISTKENAVQAA